MSDETLDALPTGVIAADEWFGIGNEFAGVSVRKVYTRNGERLELLVPRTETRILLDAMQLEIISLQNPETFSRMYQKHLGADETLEDQA
ncbi:hypothetical protein ACWF5H_01550 [Arthrobacter sp. NPDC055138]